MKIISRINAATEVESNHEKGDEDQNVQQAEVFKDNAKRKSLDDVMGPLYLTMAAFGMFHFRCGRSPIKEDQLRTMDKAVRRRRRWLAAVSRVYSTLILVVLWLNGCRLLLVFLESPTSLVVLHKVTYALWYTMCLIQCTSVYAICTRRRNDLWHFHGRIQAMCPETLHQLFAYMRRLCFRSTIAAWLIVVVNSALHAYQIFYSSISNFELVPAITALNVHVAKGLVVLSRVYVNAAWILPLIFRNILSFAIYYLFKELNAGFVKARENNDLSVNDIERYRKRHRAVCKLLETVDDNVHVMTGCDIALYVIMLCLLLYVFIWDPDVVSDSFLVAIYSFWIIASLMMLGFIGVGGALVNQEAHAIFEALHDIDFEDSTSNMKAEIVVFLNKLTSGSIGLTALKLFVIDKQSILTVFGMMITYFVMIVQFVPLTADSKCTCNCRCPSAYNNETVNYTMCA